ncbi:LAMI_0H00386g1_1 [Lachancea mirantina]|uniref:LAMI_0H00386g1_1 n=1 Tax=Lachancea mirantina TaxID=1230905 RepID=A0A1G4KDJ5_9SACH|nr:LAMI_0H00386g1_1 [Lachancea mirantina]
MPVNIIGTALIEGTDKIPYYNELKKAFPYVLAISAIKFWSRGATNTWERNLHGKVYILTGATTQGMGTAVALDMARRGAQLIILTRNCDEWSLEWCEDLRASSDNNLIYLEQCDLNDLHEVRKFATKWLDNSPPRRLDGAVVMSGDLEPGLSIPLLPKPVRRSSKDGLEVQIATNFVGVFHLLDLLQPSFKAQPPDRDVRIIVTTCMLQAMGSVNVEDPLWQKANYDSAVKFFASSKLQLSLCMLSLQRRLLKATHKDGRSGKNVTVCLVQPGIMRSTSLRRFVSNGSVLALIFVYSFLLYPLLWLFTKSASRGAQTILHALMTPELEEINWKDEQVKYIVNCTMSKYSRKEFEDVELQDTLYDNTSKQILELEKRMALQRNKQKKAQAKGEGKKRPA